MEISSQDVIAAYTQLNRRPIKNTVECQIDKMIYSCPIGVLARRIDHSIPKKEFGIKVRSILSQFSENFIDGFMDGFDERLNTGRSDMDDYLYTKGQRNGKQVLTDLQKVYGTIPEWQHNSLIEEEDL
jgi:hypothetical protein